MKGTWIREPQNGINIIFVHGISSSGDKCWRNDNGTYWPYLLRDQEGFQQVGICVFTYKTGVSSGLYSISDAADFLWEKLLDVLRKTKQLVFVCHSMGGIVVRRLIVQRQSFFNELNIPVGLFLVASPSLGSEYANWLYLLALATGHTQVQALTFSQQNIWLNDLDKDFMNLKESVSRTFPLKGRELVEDNTIIYKNKLFKIKSIPNIVETFSGARYFGEYFKVPDSDHFSIATPKDKGAIQHVLLCRFISQWLANIPPEEYLRRRIDQTNYLFKFYSKEKNKIFTHQGSKIAYLHQFNMFGDASVGDVSIIEGNELTASNGPQYEIENTNKAIGAINNFQRSVETYRVEVLKNKLPTPNLLVRLCRLSKNQFHIVETPYSSQFVTCQKEIVDTPLRIMINSADIPPDILASKSLRQLDMINDEVPSFEDSFMANTIGIAATVITCDGYLIIPKRQKSVHFQPDYHGCSVSGVLNWNDALTGEYFIRQLHSQLLDKGANELALEEGKFSIINLAFARELERAGKPQFFFHIWSDYNKDYIMNKIQHLSGVGRHTSTLHLIKVSAPVAEVGAGEAVNQMCNRLEELLEDTVFVNDSEEIIFIEGAADEGAKKIVFSEEARANLYFLERYLSTMKGSAIPEYWLSVR
jgi:hypothetical protein